MFVFAFSQSFLVNEIKAKSKKISYQKTVQETLTIPLFGRLICPERFLKLFSDLEAKT